ncbi:MAG: hypothetical protein H6747_14370 [Deltaproteobacteria bacterium]|nr:hypothetical protein [Deltaproteobacteria bacterium]
MRNDVDEVDRRSGVIHHDAGRRDDAEAVITTPKGLPVITKPAKTPTSELSGSW